MREILIPAAAAVRHARRPLLLAVASIVAGCASQPAFPPPLEVRRTGTEVVYAFDTNRDRRPDFWQFQEPNGMKDALAYEEGSSGRPGNRIDRNQLDPAECPHFVIALDGVPFELVEELYRDGYFRSFHPPARVISSFPSMTDLGLADVFHAGRCLAFQARFFDRQANRLSNANSVYLSGANAPWTRKVDYHASSLWDTIVYLKPQFVFNRELAGMLRTFGRFNRGQAAGYSVGAAGLGTRGGRPAILAYLRTVDRLCEQLIWERHGWVNITLVSDHGHNLVENRRVTFDDALRAAGYRPASRLKSPRDVVTISYGLVTYADFYTSDPAGVAQALLKHESVDFACYREGDKVWVCNRDGRAAIRAGTAGLTYDDSAGDPLSLGPIISKISDGSVVNEHGVIDGGALFAATVDHEYPDPLARIWRAFHGLVENTPDLIVNLRPGYCHGSGFFHFMIGRVASTHGALNRRDTTTFVLTTLGPVPNALRSDDVLPELNALLHRRSAEAPPTASLRPVGR